MSQENVELVRRMSEDRDLHAADDLHAWLVEFFDSEIEWHDAPSLPGAGVHHGREALLARIRYVGVGHQSGIDLEDNAIAAVYDLRRGRILRVRQFVNHAEALEAVGLSE